MSPDRTSPDALSAQTITERFDAAEVGDLLVVNGRERSYEVIDTATYSVVAEDPAGHRITFSQNLQTGGWSLNEEIFFVAREGDGSDRPEE